MLPAAILAGGLATRLRPVTEKIPKALVPINDEPFIAHQLRLLASRGITRVVLCLGYRGEMVREYVGDGGRFGIAVSYSFDWPVLRGTAGAIQQAVNLLGDEFFVLYGDSYLPCDYRAVEEQFLASSKPALMTVFPNADHWDRSNVEFADGCILVYDKVNRTPRMRHIDYGLGVFRRAVFDNVPTARALDLAAVYQELLKRGDLAALEIRERFYEAGSFAGIEELSRRLAAEAQIYTMTFTQQFLNEVNEIVGRLDTIAIERAAEVLAAVRTGGGRLFILGVGGSAANASHAVNDFRKITGIETYAPTDNVSELTARTNDEGWAGVFENWLRVSRLNASDALLVLSVGGGNIEQQVSPNLVAALSHAKSLGTKVIGIVGRDGGYTARVADVCVLIPTVNPIHVTPHAEAFQAVVWHLLVSHPVLKSGCTKWECIGTGRATAQAG
jgi:D-sedoheptulose 7-phosphate isomerase